MLQNATCQVYCLSPYLIRQPLISRNGTEPKIPWHPKLIRPRHLSGLNTCTHSHTHSGPGVTIESAYQQQAGERQNVGLMFNLSPSVLCCAFAAQKGTHAVQSYQQILPAKTCRLPVPVGVGRSDKSKLTNTHTHAKCRCVLAMKMCPPSSRKRFACQAKGGRRDTPKFVTALDSKSIYRSGRNDTALLLAAAHFFSAHCSILIVSSLYEATTNFYGSVLGGCLSTCDATRTIERRR